MDITIFDLMDIVAATLTFAVLGNCLWQSLGSSSPNSYLSGRAASFTR